MQNRTWIVAGIAAVLIASLAFQGSSVSSVSNARAESPKAKTTAKPVEPSMHEFMEYVFQPPYKRLRTVMATEPADNAAWKSIKSDSLILAEAGNLLLIRHPEKNEDTWREHAVTVRDLGGRFYQAARKKDYSAAKQSYTAMLQKCNSCHNAFADGEHQLTP